MSGFLLLEFSSLCYIMQSMLINNLEYYLFDRAESNLAVGTIIKEYLGVTECNLDSIHTVTVALAGSSPVCHP
jgi:hypothetical protein